MSTAIHNALAGDERHGASWGRAGGPARRLREGTLNIGDDTMSGPWKPEGYPSISPYVMVQGGQRLIDFLAAAFGGIQLRRFDRSDGGVMHAEVRIDDSVIMLAEASEGWRAFPIWLHLYVPDVDATYRRAIQAGGMSVQEPQQKAGDPDRRGGVKDPAGNTWWIASQVGHG